MLKPYYNSLLANILMILPCVIRIRLLPWHSESYKHKDLVWRCCDPLFSRNTSNCEQTTQAKSKLSCAHLKKIWKSVINTRNCWTLTQINHVTNLNANDTTKTRLTKMKNDYWSLRNVCLLKDKWFQRDEDSPLLFTSTIRKQLHLLLCSNCFLILLRLFACWLYSFSINMRFKNCT
jgi:hypothetical protein